MFSISSFLLASSILLSQLSLNVYALGALTIKGNKFFNPDGSQFYVKGIAYQRSPDDPLLDAEQCQNDAALMATLGANMIRVYHVSSQADHSACMAAFAAKGIYLFVDLSTFGTAIWQDAPVWNQTQLSFYAAVLENFAQYDNTAGFFIGNEVVFNSFGAQAAPFIKAAVTDIKTYVSARASTFKRPLYIGYSAADISSVRPMLQNYLACNPSGSGGADTTIDFFGLNAYEFCYSKDTFYTSGYFALNQFLIDAQYNIPFFFSEDGCNVNPPRGFEDQALIYGENMTEYWSGAIIYEWIQEQNLYGLISYGPAAVAEGFARSGMPTPVQPDFDNLSTAWAQVSPSSISMNAYTPTNKVVACPATTPGVWMVDPNAAAPTLGNIATKLVYNATPTVPAAQAPAATTSSTSRASTSTTTSVTSASTSSTLTTHTSTTTSATSASAAAATTSTKKSNGARNHVAMINASVMCMTYILLGVLGWF